MARTEPGAPAGGRPGGGLFERDVALFLRPTSEGSASSAASDTPAS